jgi:hypothetical protein
MREFITTYHSLWIGFVGKLYRKSLALHSNIRGVNRKCVPFSQFWWHGFQCQLYEFQSGDLLGEQG